MAPGWPACHLVDFHCPGTSTLSCERTTFFGLRSVLRSNFFTSALRAWLTARPARMQARQLVRWLLGPGGLVQRVGNDLWLRSSVRQDVPFLLKEDVGALLISWMPAR